MHDEGRGKMNEGWRGRERGTAKVKKREKMKGCVVDSLS